MTQDQRMDIIDQYILPVLKKHGWPLPGGADSRYLDYQGEIMVWSKTPELPLIEEAMTALTFDAPRQRLDFDKLYGKAFMITDTEGDPSRDGFSIITPLC